MNCKLCIKKITNNILHLLLLFIAFTSNSCASKKVLSPTPSSLTTNQLFQTSGFEEVVKELDGDIMEFDVSSNSRYIAYSTNAYKNVFQILLLDLKENKKQYIIPEDIEQRSPKIYNDDIYFIRIDKGTSYLTNYNIKQNLFKTVFKVKSIVLTLSVSNDTLSFAINDKGLWKIWLFHNNKFILVDYGFYPCIQNGIIYYQKPNQKENPFYSIFAYDFTNTTKYSILYHSGKSFLSPSVSKNANMLSYVEFSDNIYYLKIQNLKNNQQYTLLKSQTPILSPNLNVEGYIYFILQNEGKFSIYRFKL